MAMLDLNEDVIPSDSANAEEEEPMELQHSGTSKSSVVNSDEAANLIADQNSMNSSSTFIFDILKKETQEDAKENPEPEIITRTFFPVSGHLQDGDSNFKSGFPAWLNLSFAEAAGVDARPKILQQRQPQVRKSRRGPRSKSSQYRGVTFYRRTGRWESHIWDCGKQVYLGGFDTANAAARAYDRAAIKFRGVDADINFSLSDYEEDLNQTRNLSKEEFVHILRRRSTGIPRGGSKYKNIALQNFAQFEPRAGQFLGNNAREKPLMKCDGRDGSTSFVDVSKGGGGHNLELGLGISPLEKVVKGNNDGAAQFSFCYAAAVRGIPRSGEPMADSSGHPVVKGQAIYGLTMAPKYDQVCPPFYPAYIQNCEERGREKILQAVALPRFSNFAWQLHSNGGIAAAAPVFSIAASSGFASSTNIASSSAPIPINTHNKSFCNYCSTTASAINSSCLQNSGS